jgi:hypothetical protein
MVSQIRSLGILMRRFIVYFSYRSHRQFLLLLSFLPVLFFAACDNTFSPKEPYKERVVVFSVLDATAPYQVIRLETTFDAETTNPDKPLNQRTIDSARVTIQSDRKLFVFHDTLLLQPSGEQKRVWISRDLVPAEGITYHLSVKVPGFDEITADVKVPSKPYLQTRQITYAEGVSGLELFAGAISTVATPQGFYFRLWVAGDKEIDGNIVEVRREVPAGFNGDTQQYYYTLPGRETSVIFPVANIITVREDLVVKEKVTALKIIATGYSFDTYLYSYYKIVRGFDDPVSIRQDSPDITNIRGGVGMLGALVTDSIRARYTDIVSY